ncbi:MAG: 30S ribosomal protein S7, partial [Candidatus Thermoplasmatota archaeon]|nr:30S ribosomal protein S7 [Candidatus Thermoplasmatota archaeon]MBU1940974.1 30S ribosomal protein S7 [Candidatus Thermoplasmatota archaeon]
MTEKTTSPTASFFPALDKYDMSTVTIEDKGLERYINIETKDFFLGAPHANRLFGKSNLSTIERIMNNLMRTENYSGKKTKSYKVLRDAIEIIEKKTKTNPMQSIVDALQNAAPKEETTRLRFGGINVPKAVDIAPQRRLDIAIRNICLGACNASHKNKKSIE